MINKIIFLFLLSFVFISCGDINNNDTAIGMKITPLSTFEGLSSFKVTAQEIDEAGKPFGKLYESCKDYSENKEVTFDLDKSDSYLFKFSGYIKPNCSGDRDWLGSSISKININDVNNVKISVSKINSFVFSSTEMHQAVAFMDVTMLNDDIILSGGALYTNKTLKRIKNLQCDESSTDDLNFKCSAKDLNNEGKDWICNTDGEGNYTSCYDVIDATECKAQGGDDDDCVACLVANDHKFDLPDSECYAETCLINAEGYGCNLKGSVLVQKIDTNNLSSNLLRDKDNNFLKLSETRILHQSLSYNNEDIYFVGGAAEAKISNRAPFIFPKKAGNRTNLIDVYNKGIISNFSLNTDLGNDILVDFNVFRTDDKFFVLNGRKNEFFNDDSYFDKVIECNMSTSNCNFVTTNNPHGIYSIGAGIIDTLNNEGNFISFIIGGISNLLNNYKIKYNNSLAIEGVSGTLTFGSLYKPHVFHSNDLTYVLGGLKFSHTNDGIKFNGINNEIYVYQQDGREVATYTISGDFKDTVFSQILTYSYNGKEGLLFVAGLKKDSNDDFDAINSVAFISFEDINSQQAFIPLPSLNKPRFGHSVVIDKNNRIWVVGGLTNTINSRGEVNKGDFFVDKTIEIYTPKPDEAN